MSIQGCYCHLRKTLKGFMSIKVGNTWKKFFISLYTFPWMGIKSPRLLGCLNLVHLPTFQQWKKPTPFKYSNLLINLTFHMYTKHPIKLVLLFILLTEMPFSALSTSQIDARRKPYFSPFCGQGSSLGCEKAHLMRPTLLMLNNW